MRILHVTQRYLPAIGGAELYLAGISERLAADGHQVTVLTTDAHDFELFWDPQARRIDEPEAVINGVRVVRLPVRHLPVPHLAYPAIRRLLWLLTRTAATPLAWVHRLARFTPWVPQLHEWLESTPETFDLVGGMTVVFEPLLEAGRRFAHRRNLPFVIYPLTHLGAGPKPADDVLSRFYTMRHQVDLVVNSSYLIAINHDEADYYQQQGMARTQMCVAGPGIEVDTLLGGDGERLRTRLDLAGPIVGMVSSLAYDKGAPHLVQALCKLWDEGRTVHLVLAGAVMSQFQTWLATLPPAHRARVHVLGSVDHQTKLDLLDALDLFAMPSRTDSFGIAYLEAWVYQKPVIGARAWGVRTVIDEGKDGLLIPFGDVDALAQAIGDLLDDLPRRQAMGRAGYDKVMAQHTWQHKYPRVRQVYHDLVEGGRPSVDETVGSGLSEPGRTEER